MSDPTDWKTWLSDPALTGTTPVEHIDSAISRVAAEPIATCERLLRGEQNEVYAITTAGDEELIVRISRRPKSPFYGERWVIDALRLVGVPTPEVLLAEELPGESPSSLCVQRRLAGVPLADLSDTPGQLDEGERAHYAHASGEMLRRIHSVETHGYGFLDATGVGADADWGVFVRMPIAHADRFGAAAEKAGLTSTEFARATALLRAAAAELAHEPARLVHQDYLPKHILVRDRAIVGVIDFEVARGGDPVYDFAMWDVYQSLIFPTDALLDGYFAGDARPTNFDFRLNVYRLHFALRVLYYSATGFAGFVPLALAVARDAMDTLS